MLCTIAMIDRSAPLPVFLTLTHPNLFPTAQEHKRLTSALYKRLFYQFPMLGMIKKLEPQERGAPHDHCLIWGVTEADISFWKMREMIPQAWYEIAGQGDINHWKFHTGNLPRSEHCLQAVRSWRGVWSYAAKYLGKTFEVNGWDNVGRYWGLLHAENIPFGKFKGVRVTEKFLNELIRYQRRYSHRSSFGRGMTTFCDADQWVEKLKITG